MNDAATRAAQATGAAQARLAILVAVAAAAAALITGCSASPSQPDLGVSHASSSPAAAPSSVPASTPATPAATAAAAATTSAPATPQPSATASSPAPTLGQLAGVFAQGQGFGQVKPSRIFNGGDPTGLVKHITWPSWGAARAIGYGQAEYVGPNQSVATGKQKPATVVAFHLGRCDGKLMYRAVEWYFPGQGQSFNPKQYENVCTGSYVPGS